MLLEKEITEKLDKIEEICGGKNLGKMTGEKRKEALHIITSANNFYGLLVQQIGKSDSYVSLGERLKEISNTLLEYQS